MPVKKRLRTGEKGSGVFFPVGRTRAAAEERRQIACEKKTYLYAGGSFRSFKSFPAAGKSAKNTEEEVTIGVVTKSKSSEYWLSVCDGMEDAAENTM